MSHLWHLQLRHLGFVHCEREGYFSEANPAQILTLSRKKAWLGGTQRKHRVHPPKKPSLKENLGWNWLTFAWWNTDTRPFILQNIKRPSFLVHTEGRHEWASLFGSSCWQKKPLFSANHNGWTTEWCPETQSQWWICGEFARISTLNFWAIFLVWNFKSCMFFIHGWSDPIVFEVKHKCPTAKL